jgi:uncharacterized protein
MAWTGGDALRGVTRTDLSRRSGILTHRRERLRWAKGQEFRVLSIDGGGIKGILPANVLALLEQEFCQGSIARQFDLVVGTSTGGIIALALGAGMEAANISRLYEERGREIFPPHPLLGHILLNLRSWVRHRRDRASLDRMLEGALGSRTLAEAQARLCIPALDAEHGGEIYVFKTPHHPDYRRDWKRSMVEAAKATSAAQSYLLPFRSGVNEFLDGGLWANNPILVGVVEALSAFDVDPSQVRVLSLGCAESRYRIGRWQRSLGGKLFWAGNVVEAALHFQSQSALGQAGLLIGADRIFRLAAPPLSQEIALDDWEAARKRLPTIARQLVDEFGEPIATTFLDGERTPFVPFHGRTRSSAGAAIS